MAAAGTGIAALAVRRLRLDLHVPPSAAGEAGALRRRLERAVRHALPALLAAQDGGGGGGADGPVLLIRRLELELPVGSGAGEAAILDRLAAALLTGVAAAAAAAGPAGGAIVRFPDRAHHAAAFVDALASGGGAWGRWWFRGFAGLRPLPPAAAIRTALLRDPAAVPRVLAALPEAARLRVLEALGPREAEAALRALPAAPGGDAETPEAAWDALAEAALATSMPAGSAQAVLALLAAAQAAAPGRPVLGLLPAVRALAAVAPMLAAGAARPANLGSGTSLAGAAPRQPGEALAGLPAPLRAALSARLATSTAVPVASTIERHLRLGGLVLLLPGLLALDLDAAAADWPAAPAEGAGPAAMLRLLALASCAGRDRAAGIWEEPTWGELLGIPRLDRDGLAGWSARVGARRWRGLGTALGLPASPPPMAGVALPRTLLPGVTARGALAGIASHLLRGFARRLPGFAGSSAAFLRANLLDVPARMEFRRGEVSVLLARPPLDVLLGITGAARFACPLPDGRRLMVDRVP